MSVSYTGPFKDEDGRMVYRAVDTDQRGYYLIGYTDAGSWFINQYDSLTNKLIFGTILQDDLLPTGDMDGVWVRTDLGMMNFGHLYRRYGMSHEGRPRPWWYEQMGGYPGPVEWYVDPQQASVDDYYGDMADAVGANPEDDFSILDSLAAALGIKLHVTKAPELGMLERLNEFV